MENTLARREEGETWRHIGEKKNRRRQFPADSTRFFPYLWWLVMVVVVVDGARSLVRPLFVRGS